jgi:hypothetical protein
MNKLNNVMLYTHPKAKLYQQAMVKSQVLKVWEEVVEGFFKQAKGLTQAVEFKQGKLFVACLSHTLASQIIAMAKSLVRAINEMLGKVVVYALAVEY